MAQQQSTGALKRFEVVKQSTFTYRELEIHHDGRPFLWVNLDMHMFHSTMMTFHTNSSNGPVVAGAKFPKLSNMVEVTIGDPANASDENYVSVDQNSMTGSSYVFQGVDTGHMYEWRRTHDNDLEASHLSNSDFKLVDPSNNDKVLAVYVKDSFFGGSGVAHMDFFVQLQNDLELQAMTAILAIEERLRRKRNNNIGGGAGRVGSIQGTASASAANTMN